MDDTPLLCPCEFQLVLRYNPEPGETIGRDIEPETLLGIFNEINRKFGAYTPIGAPDGVGGSWEGQTEPSMRIEIAVAPSRVAEVREYVIELGRRLGQAAMYFKAMPPCVEIIDMTKQPGKSVEGNN